MPGDGWLAAPTNWRVTCRGRPAARKTRKQGLLSGCPSSSSLPTRLLSVCGGWECGGGRLGLRIVSSSLSSLLFSSSSSSSSSISFSTSVAFLTVLLCTPRHHLHQDDVATTTTTFTVLFHHAFPSLPTSSHTCASSRCSHCVWFSTDSTHDCYDALTEPCSECLGVIQPDALHGDQGSVCQQCLACGIAQRPLPITSSLTLPRNFGLLVRKCLHGRPPAPRASPFTLTSVSCK